MEPDHPAPQDAQAFIAPGRGGPRAVTCRWRNEL